MSNWNDRCAFRTSIAAAGLAAAIMLAPAVLSAQDLTLHQTTTVRGQDTATTSYLGKNATRQNGVGGQDVIVRFDTRKVVTIDHKKKTYSEMTFDDLQKMADAATAQFDKLPPEVAAKMRGMSGQGGQASVTKLGPGETIAGYRTEKYHVVMSPIEMDLWVTPDIVMPAAYYDAMKSLMPSSPMMDMKRLYEEYKKIQGTPMKTVTNMKMMGQTITTTTLVTAVDKTPIPASTFEIPAGYKAAPMR